MPFYPSSAVVPQELRTDWFVARPLRASDAALDHAAYMASPATIARHSAGRWPTANFTVADNAPLAAQHEADHQARTNFTFLLLDPPERQAVGCAYLLPLVPFLARTNAPQLSTKLGLEPAAANAMLTFWVREDLEPTGLPTIIVHTLWQWIITAWAFDQVVVRVNTAEQSSILACGAAGLVQRASVALSEPPVHYLLFGDSAGHKLADNHGQFRSTDN